MKYYVENIYGYKEKIEIDKKEYDLYVLLLAQGFPFVAGAILSSEKEEDDEDDG